MSLAEPKASRPREPQSGDRYRRILVPLDGTAFAEAALAPAARVAERTGGVLHLATAFAGHRANAIIMEPLPTDGLEPPQSTDLEAYLARVGERIGQQRGVEVSSCLLPGGPPALALARHARVVGADLIVAATHGHGVIARAVLGSVTADLVKEAICPVLLVPAPESGPDGAPLQGPVRSVLVGLDPDDPTPRHLLAHAVAFARLDGATLHVARVVLRRPLPTVGLEGGGPVETGPGVELDPAARVEAERRLTDIVDSLRSQGVEARAQLLDGMRPADALVSFADANGIDVIVVGRHAKGAFERLWKGSESDRVARTAEDSAVLICPERERD